jgi:GWxTD domain-containing protein
MPKAVSCIAFMAIVLCITVSGVSQPKHPSPLHIAVDYARFRGDEKNTYVEIYYAFSQRMVTYVPSAEGFKAAVDLTVTISLKDSVVFADRSLIPHTTKDTINGTMNLISLSNLMLPEGDYILKVKARDANDTSRNDSLLIRLPVKIGATDRPVLSDIEFASAIRKGKKGSPFFKNTLEVIPNVDGLYGSDQDCFYYAEAYNLLAGNEKNDFTLKTSIFNAAGREVVSRERPRKRSAESSVLVDNFSIQNLRSGTYTLVLSLHDSVKKAIASAAKKFYVFNSVLGVDSTLLDLDPSIGLTAFATMAEVDIDHEFKWARWEAGESEQDQYKRLQGVDAKRKFIKDFWARRPAGYRDQYLKRVAYANSTFKELGKEGFITDRGRVHIMYGTPDDIDRHPNESGTRPYEIWAYNNIQGGVIFVFVQRQNSGAYDLVHSTHRNELHDENWERFAQTN